MGKVAESADYATFNIHGMRLAVGADAAWLREGVCEALRPFRAPIADADAVMRLLAGIAAPGSERPTRDCRGRPVIRPEHAEPAQFRFGAMCCYRAAERLVYTDGASTILVDPGRSLAEGTVSRAPDASADLPWRAWSEPVFAFALLELLRHFGLYHLHAAAVDPGAGGVLLAGDSGAGKTTLTLLLARAGWGFLSDDAVLLRLTSEGVEARALPVPFHVDPTLGAHLPELAPLRDTPAYNAGTRRELRPERVYGREYLPGTRPRLLLLPRVYDRAAPPPAEAAGPGLWLRRISPGQAVAELIRTSALVLLDERAAAGHVESLRRLATGCPAYRLYHGPAVLAAPDACAGLIARLLEAASSTYDDTTHAPGEFAGSLVG